MSFLHPGWFLLLLILPLIVLGAVLAHRGRNKAWRRMVAPRLRQQLVKEGSNTRRWISLALGLLGCALIIVTITRPYKGETTRTEQIRTRNILIAIDTSRSMLVQDASPDRMGSAKAMAIELTQAFPNDRIGIIAFSGAPVLMAPLTIDHSAVHETVSQLDTNVIPSGGSDLAAAVQLAIKTLKKSGSKSSALIVISDGEDHSQQINLAGSEIREAGIAVCTIGVGTAQGDIIPDPRSRDGKYHDYQGNTVLSQLNPKALTQLARAGRGSYVPAASGANSTIKSALSFLESDRQAGRTVSVPTENYQWFLLPAILTLVLSLLVRSDMFANKLTHPSTSLPTKPSSSTKPTGPATSIATMLLIALSLFTTTPVRAETDIEKGETAYSSKDYTAALESFSRALQTAQGEDRRAIQFSQGSSAYRLQQWENATRYFSRSLLTNNSQLQEQSHYNLGNTLFQSGWSILAPHLPKTPETTNPFLGFIRQLLQKQQAQPQSPQQPSEQQPLTKADIQHIMTNWQDAITHYQAALTINPDNKDAKHNHKEVKKLLKQLQDAVDQAQKESGEGEQPQQDQGDSPDKKKGEGEDEGEGEDKNQGKGNNPEQQPNKDGEGNGDPDKQPEKPDSGDQNNDDPKDSPPNNSQPQEVIQAKRKEGESKEAFAARILKEHSDTETRPVNRRFLRIRRPAKDW